MILKIVKYPEPILSQPGEPVTEFNAELRKLVADMFETTYATQGIGLAAPQVGVSKRVTVIDLSMGKDPKDKLVLINPEIISSEGKLYEEEGCLSFPDIREKVVRAAKVSIRAQDENGKWFEMDGEELLCARVSARDRPPGRHSVSVPHERAEAQPEHCARFARCRLTASGRAVKLVFCGTPALRCSYASRHCLPLVTRSRWWFRSPTGQWAVRSN